MNFGRSSESGSHTILSSPYAMALAGLVVLGFVIAHPFLLWILGTIAVLGVAMAFVLRWYYSKIPVKLQDTTARTVLGLDEEEKPSGEPKKDGENPPHA
jgi:type III secretory pathway component EscV